MSNIDSRISFIVMCHKALKFKDNEIFVNKFIRARLEHFFPNCDIIFGKSSQLVGACVELLNINPLIDVELVEKMILTWIENPYSTVTSLGAIPGSAPIRVFGSQSNPETTLVVKTSSQKKYNTQLNLYKLKRQKHFISFVKNIDNLYKYTINEFMKYLETELGTSLFLKFGEDVTLVDHICCPYCKSSEFRPLYCKSSHSLNGFLPSSVSIYNECLACSLVYLRKTFPKDQLDLLYDEYLNEVGLQKIDNRVFHQLNENHMFRTGLDYIYTNLPKKPKIVDLGCGSGDFLLHAKSVIPDGEFVGLDYNIDNNTKQSIVANGITIVEGDLLKNIRSIKEIDLVTSWEVIEHIFADNLDDYLQTVLGSLSKDGYFIFSTPDYDNLICRLFDFWAVCPIQHMTVLSEKWLEKYLKKSGAIVVEKYHGNQMLKDNSWSEYCLETSPNEEELLYIELINILLKKSKSKDSFLNSLKQNNLGSEIIYIVQKAN